MFWKIAGIVMGCLCFGGSILFVFGALILGKKADELSSEYILEKLQRIVSRHRVEKLDNTMGTRHGDWLQTHTGIHFYPLDPRPEEIDILDIAHSLSLQCRFAGHVREHYSVAEHCVRASWIVPPADALWALLHDAAEAYLVDLPRPLKNLPEFSIYRTAENMIMTAVISRFRLSPHEPKSVRFADDTLLATEARDLMGSTEGWAPMLVPLKEKIIPWNPETAKDAFLARYVELKIKDYTPAGAGIPAEV